MMSRIYLLLSCKFEKHLQQKKIIYIKLIDYITNDFILKKTYFMDRKIRNKFTHFTT